MKKFVTKTDIEQIDYKHVKLRSEEKDVLDWCFKNCEGRFFGNGTDWHFEKNEDALMFAIRWGEK